MSAVADPARLLPPAARTELDRYPLTETERAPHEDGPLGAVAGWYYCGAGCGLLALALHELTGLPLVGVLRALGDRDAEDLPLELMLEAGVARDAHVLCACGWRAAVEGVERLVGVAAARVRALCEDGGGVDPDDPPTLAAARAAAALLLERAGHAPG
jgi:hypothetical protein